MFKIVFYTDKNGNQPIKKYIYEPYVKHIDDEIWELRPLRDRFFFFCWHGDILVLLHHFVKGTQKTPPREIEKAKRNLKDFIERIDDNEK